MTRRSRPRGTLPLAAVVTLSLGVATGSCSPDSDREDPTSSAGTGARGGAPGDSGPEGGAGALASGGTDPDADAGAAGSAPNGEPPVDPPTCPELATWSSAVPVLGVSSSAQETFLSITPDELDLAFLRDDALYVAHRSSATERFQIGAEVVVPSGFSASHGVSISADGQRLVLVSDPDQKKLAELTRASRTAPFTGDVDEGAFVNINRDAVYTGKLYAAPAVSGRDEQLMFNSAFPGGESTVVVSTRGEDGTWSAPQRLVTALLDGAAGERRLPSGVSADARTLFYFNEASASEEVRWRSTINVNAPLYQVQTLAGRRGAAPNLDCNRLYSSVDGDVVVETD